MKKPTSRTFMIVIRFVYTKGVTRGYFGLGF